MKEIETTRKFVRERKEALFQTIKSVKTTSRQVSDSRVYINYVIKKIPELKRDLENYQTKLPELQKQLEQKKVYLIKQLELKKVQEQKCKLAVGKLKLMENLQQVEREIGTEVNSG